MGNLRYFRADRRPNRALEMSGPRMKVISRGCEQAEREFDFLRRSIYLDSRKTAKAIAARIPSAADFGKLLSCMGIGTRTSAIRKAVNIPYRSHRHSTWVMPPPQPELCPKRRSNRSDGSCIVQGRFDEGRSVKRGGWNLPRKRAGKNIQAAENYDRLARQFCLSDRRPGSCFPTVAMNGGDRNRSDLVRRKLEIHQVAAEALRLPRSEGYARGHPNGSEDQRFGAEVQPEKQANDEA
jgi:hypothetical protein